MTESQPATPHTLPCLYLLCASACVGRALQELAEQAGVQARWRANTLLSPQEVHVATSDKVDTEGRGQATIIRLPATAREVMAALAEARQQLAVSMALPGGEHIQVFPPLLRHGNLEQPLTEREVALLQALLQHGKMDRQRLLTHVWRYHEDVETRTLETHLYRLRKKLKAVGGKSQIRFLEQTVWLA